VIHNVRHLRQILGPIPFLSLAYSLMVGRQLILRGQPSGLIASISDCLNVSNCVTSHSSLYKTSIHSEVVL
jgi:hypothetical protein